MVSCMSVQHLWYAWYLWFSEEGVSMFGTGIKDGFKYLHVFRELKPSHLKEQVLLTAKPALYEFTLKSIYFTDI